MLKSLLMLTVILAAGIFSYANERGDKVDALMSAYNRLEKFDGAVLVAEDNKIVFKKGYGFANREWKIPNSPETKFRIASITKQFTSLLVFQLAQEGKINLDAKITDYLKDYRSDTGAKVTVYQLLTHTSGIPNWETDAAYAEKAKNRYMPDYFVKTYLSGDLAFEPGTKFVYSNGDYFLLGRIIETVTGKSWEENLRERILKPLGMSNSGVDTHNEILANKASGYVKENGKFVDEPYFDLQNYYSAGAMYSTVDDLFKWFQSFDDEKLLNKDLRAKMFAPLKDKGNVACGSWVWNKPLGDKKPLLIERSGSVYGFQLHTIHTDDGKTVILLANNEAENVYGMAQNVLNILYNQPYEQPK
jgi:CubicO group peptidase (beta-lactamase class C family)